MKKVLVVDPIHEEGIKLLKKEVEVIIEKESSLETLLEQVRSVDGIIVRGTNISKEIIKNANKLKVIGSHGSGVDSIDISFATEKGVIVVNTPDAPTESVTEHVIGFMLVLAKNILLANRALREGKFKSKYDYIGKELANKNLGIIGLGRIGLSVAKKCIDGFNMKVLGYDIYIPRGKRGKIEEMGINIVNNLDILLKESDFVSLNVPLTKETKNMIGDKELRLMKPTAYLINTARGGVIDEKALIKALKKKEIAGAALDVFTIEPPQLDNPLIKMENVCATPHIAIATEEALIRTAVTSAEEVLKVLRGEKPHYIVNPEVLKK